MSRKTETEPPVTATFPGKKSSVDLAAKSKALIAQSKQQVKQSAKVSQYSAELLSEVHENRKK